MLPSLPDGAPAGLGWSLFVLALIGWFVHLRLKARTDTSQARKNDLDVTRGHMELLKLSAESYQSQLNAIANALASDAQGQPSLEELERLRRREVTATGRSVLDHLLSRQKARAELPRVIGRLHEVQRRRLDIEQDIQAGLAVKDKDVRAIRADLTGISDSLSSLIQEIAESPRFFVSETPPEDANDGDLWIQPQSSE
jgi:hypothetical protein